MGGLLTDFVEHHKNGEQIRGLPQINSARSLMIIMKKKYLLDLKYTSCHVSTWEEIQEMVKLKAIKINNNNTLHYGPTRARKNIFKSIWKLGPFSKWPAQITLYFGYSSDCKTSENMFKLTRLQLLFVILKCSLSFWEA